MPGDAMTDAPGIDIAAMKTRLLERRAEIEHIMETGESTRQGEIDQSAVGRLSRMDAMQVQAMEAETARRREAELHRIDAALERIAEDEYGWCVTCGEKIAPKRLENDPAASQCVDCAGKARG
jgi:DnaK suppressor protein